MTQVIDIVKGALSVLRVQDAHTPVQDDDAAYALTRLNMMMRAIEAQGYAFGWSDVETVDDDMPTEPHTDEAIMYCLAVRMRARYGTSLDPDTVAAASASLDALWREQQENTFSEPTYDSLPIGVGRFRCNGNPYR